MYDSNEIMFPYRVTGIDHDVNRFRNKKKKQEKSFKEELEKKLDKEENTDSEKEKRASWTA